MDIMTVTTDIVPGFDGAPLAVHRLGAGRPLLLFHGLMSSARVNWIKYGQAARLADAGFEAIMPDLRAHGHSAAPHDPAAYPPDVLVRDALAVIEALGLDDFDLAGFSLGARLSAMLLGQGVRPGKAILGGMGLDGLTHWARRRDFFLNAIARMDVATHGDPDFMAIQFMKTMKVDVAAVRLLIGGLGDFDAASLARIDLPVLVLCGVDDRDNGAPEALAERLSDARLATVPGGHMSCITHRDFGEAMVAFLTA
jgi:pimeloyl-ACP methyl ester carboxylesterase